MREAIDLLDIEQKRKAETEVACASSLMGAVLLDLPKEIRPAAAKLFRQHLDDFSKQLKIGQN